MEGSDTDRRLCDKLPGTGLLLHPQSERRGESLLRDLPGLPDQPGQLLRPPGQLENNWTNQQVHTKLGRSKLELDYFDIFYFVEYVLANKYWHRISECVNFGPVFLALKP